jgi:hypothetical protein
MPSLTGLLLAPVFALVGGIPHHRPIVHSPPPAHVSQAAVRTPAAPAAEAPLPANSDQTKPSDNTQVATADAQPAATPSGDDTPSANPPSATDQLIADATALRNRYRDYRSGKSHDAVPLYEFRTMEQRLDKVAAADPGNAAITDLSNSMQMIQAEILGPAIQRSMIVKRKMFAEQAQSDLGQSGVQVSVAGPANTTARFQAPSLTRQSVMKMGADDKLFDQLRMLDFKSAVFTDGHRNHYTYNVAQQRLR